MFQSGLMFAIFGLLLLLLGAEALVRGASGLAGRLGISPLVIGLTVVAFGTSSPEMAVTIQSALAGKADIAVGNVVGSNIFNVLFILGLSATISPLAVSHSLIRIDVPFMIGTSFLLLLLGRNGSLSPFESVLLTAAFTAYLLFRTRLTRKREISRMPPPSTAKKRYVSKIGPLLTGMLIIGGLALLVTGSRFLVNGSTVIARALGVSELVTGLTVVAAGTSLPEAATSVLASIRGERDIAVGNVVGSNIFNILAIMGITGIISPGGIPIPFPALRFDIPLMIASAVACLPIFFTGQRIDRWEGVLFLGYYGAYAAYLVLKSTQHASLPFFSTVMAVFVFPITTITLITVTVRSLKGRKG